MTTANNHLLQKVTFEIGLASQDGAFEIQNRISNAFRSGILRELEKLFDRKSIPGVVISIDKIEINLGNLNSSRLEEDLMVAFERELDGFLATLKEEISRAETSSFTKSKKVNVRWSVPGNPHFEAEVTVSENSVSHFDKVIQLLEFGVLPEWGGSASGQKVSELMHAILEHHPERLVAFLRKSKDKTQVFRRLAMNLLPDQLQYLISLLGCPFSAELPLLVKELLSFFTERKVHLTQLSIQGGASFRSPEQLIWWLLLLKFTNAGSSAVLNTESNADNPDVVKNITGSAVRVAAEIIFLTERLSKRSFLSTNGFRKRKRRRSSPVEDAISLVFKMISTTVSKEESIPPYDATKVEVPIGKEGSILNDSTSLLHNSLFTLPDKNDRPESHLAKDYVGEIPGSDTGLYINNAGLIILGPYLRPFFARLGLIEGKEFTSPQAAWKAVHLLQHACGFVREEQEQGWSEHDLVFNKILCGIDLPDAVPEILELSTLELDELNALLTSVLQNWTIMQRSSVFALQSTFLQKKGRLSISGSDWELLVERDSAVEILIDKLPWAISMTKLPWNDYTIHCQW